MRLLNGQFRETFLKGDLNMQLLGNCSELLVSLLETHGIVALNNEGCVTLPKYPCYRFGLLVYKSEENIVLLEALCEIGSEQLIRERLAGVGETQAAAVIDAQRNFVNSVFHVWLSALLGISNLFVSDYFRQVNGLNRQITIGSPSQRGDASLAENTGWQEIWCQAISSLPLSTDLHWASFCYVQNAGKLIACDALLDNSACELLKGEMLKFDWPHCESFYSVRQFLIIKPLIGSFISENDPI